MEELLIITPHPTSLRSATTLGETHGSPRVVAEPSGLAFGKPKDRLREVG